MGHWQCRVWDYGFTCQSSKHIASPRDVLRKCFHEGLGNDEMGDGMGGAIHVLQTLGIPRASKITDVDNYSG